MYASSPTARHSLSPGQSPRSVLAERVLRSVASQSRVVASQSVASVASGQVSRPACVVSVLRPLRSVEVRRVLASKTCLPLSTAYRREGPRTALAGAFRHLKRTGMAAKVARLARRFAAPTECSVASVACVDRPAAAAVSRARPLH